MVLSKVATIIRINPGLNRIVMTTQSFWHTLCLPEVIAQGAHGNALPLGLIRSTPQKRCGQMGMAIHKYLGLNLQRLAQKQLDRKPARINLWRHVVNDDAVSLHGAL